MGVLRYSNCWEDADVLLAGLAPAPGSRILSIGSAGDNSFSLLSASPSLLLCTDISEVQLHLIAFKKACFEKLSHPEMLDLLGFVPGEGRADLYSAIRDAMPPAARDYWDKNTSVVMQGVVNTGKLDRYLLYFGRRILSWLQPGSNIRRLMESKSEESQKEFFHERWNTRRWRVFFKLFFSRFMLGRFGRDPRMLEEVQVNVSEFILRRAQAHLTKMAAQHNGFLRYIIQGSFEDLPHYARPENFNLIRDNLGALQTHRGFAEDACHEARFHYFNLSNIFDYMSREQFRSTGEKLLAAAEPGGRLAYWNLMVPRRLSEVFPHRLKYLADLSASLHQRDKGFFYSSFIVEEKV